MGVEIVEIGDDAHDDEKGGGTSVVGCYIERKVFSVTCAR